MDQHQQKNSQSAIMMTQKNKSFSPVSFLSFHLPLRSKNDSNDDDVVRIQISDGSKVCLNNICLDVSEFGGGLERVRVLFRCIFNDANGVENEEEATENGTSKEEEKSWHCLCNFLTPGLGGIGLPPSLGLNFDVSGPCEMEWKTEVTLARKSKAASLMSSSQGVFVYGKVLPSEINCLDGEIGLSSQFVKVETSEKASRIIAGDSNTQKGPGNIKQTNKSNIDKREADNNIGANDVEKGSEGTGNETISSNDNIKTPSSKSNKVADQPNARESTPGAPSSRKRKIAQPDTPTTASVNDLEENKSKEDGTPNDGNKKLSRKQRKKLAEQKAKQLEEALFAARHPESTSDKDSKTPDDKTSKKKKSKSEDASSPSSQSRPTSLTKERRLPGGILLRDILIGTGIPVNPGRRIAIQYTAKLHSTGKVFDKNHSKTSPLVFRQGTGEVIRGLERGLEGMKVGGERWIMVPSKLGYGDKGSGGVVPPGADLVFEVKVVKVG